MKARFLLSFLSIALLFVACDKEQPSIVQPTEPGPDSIDCPAPVETVHGRLTPPYASVRQAVSHDSRHLAYVNGETHLHVLDLLTMNDRKIDVQAMLPDSVFLLDLTTLLWCPYDNDRLLLHTVTLTNISGNGSKRVYGYNSYILSLANGELFRITPNAFGPAGSTQGYGIVGWLVGSTPSLDSFHMGMSRGIFILQEQKFVPNPHPRFIKQNRTGSSYLGLEYIIAAGELLVYIDDQRVVLPQNPAGINNISWSPNGKKVALSVLPKQRGPKGTFEQIWIIDVDRFLRERSDTPAVSVIDLQMRFCMYSFLGCHAEFITDSTLAVSMHPDGASSCLWEISITGRRIRQLTFLP